MTKSLALLAVWFLSLNGVRLEATQLSDMVSYQVPSEITLHEPVILDVMLRNDLSKVVTADFGESCVSHFEFDLQRPDGSHSVAHPRGISDPRAGSGFEGLYVFHVEPGHTESCWVVLNQFLDLSAVGAYQLQIRFNGAVQTNGGAVVDLTRTVSREMRVLPRSEETLRRVCANLLTASRDPIVDRSSRAVRALAYVDDPVAIPFLQEAAELDVFATVEIEGLVRIGGPEARKALEALLRSSNQRTADLARGALNRIK